MKNRDSASSAGQIVNLAQPRDRNRDAQTATGCFIAPEPSDYGS
jgi:hypothetical protein